MRLDQFDLNSLVALDALLTEKNVSLAAWRVGVSQSTMSGILRKLREQLDDELLVGTARNGRLTPRAEALREPLRTVLHLVRSEIIAPARFDPATASRRFRVQSSDYTNAVLLAQAVHAIRAKAPGLEFELVGPRGNSNLMFQQGRIDLSVSLEPHASPEHPCKFLFEDHYVLLLSKDHALLGDGISEAEYLAQSHIAVQIDDRRLPFAETWLSEHFDPRRRIEIFCPSYIEIPQFMAGTNLVAVVHGRLAKMITRQGPFRTLPLPFDIPSVRHIIQWPSSAARDPGVEWVVEQIVSASLEQADEG